MANSMCFSPLTSIKPLQKQGGLISPNSNGRDGIRINDLTHNSNGTRFKSLEARANNPNNIQRMKTNSIVCPDCEGNGAVLCPQCQGGGVNLVDHFDGRYKAGGLCWLCRGKKDVLCGNCNGAGFVGGFMSSDDS